MEIPESVRALERDLRATLGDRLHSLVRLRAGAGAHGVPTLAVVDQLSADDLAALAEKVGPWHDAGLATPIVLATGEFNRSLDAFPLEFGTMVADYVVVYGQHVFDGLLVDPADLRLACERQARSHLLHLREGYLEAQGRGAAVADLVVRSAAPLAALVRNMARLTGSTPESDHAAAARVETAGGFPPGSLTAIVALANGGSLSSADARRLFPQYLDVVCQMTSAIDGWSPA